MKNFTTLTEKIRSQILYNYEVAKQEYEKVNAEEEYEEGELNEDEINNLDELEYCLEEILLDGNEEYENQVLYKVIRQIDNSKYKNITYLIMMQDIWEYLKVKQIANIELLDYEKSMLEFLEIWDLKNSFKKINSSNEFKLDLFILFIEYHYTHEIENRMINRKLIELSNNHRNYEKFKIKHLDDIQYQYKKTGKIH